MEVWRMPARVGPGPRARSGVSRRARTGVGGPRHAPDRSAEGLPILSRPPVTIPRSHLKRLCSRGKALDIPKGLNETGKPWKRLLPTSRSGRPWLQDEPGTSTPESSPTPRSESPPPGHPRTCRGNTTKSSFDGIARLRLRTGLRDRLVQALSFDDSARALPDLSHVRPTGARVAVRRLLVLCRATLPTLTRSLSELEKRLERLRRRGPWGPSEVVKPSPAPTAATSIWRQRPVRSRGLGGRGLVGA
jgi:hypothetical protein